MSLNFKAIAKNRMKWKTVRVLGRDQLLTNQKGFREKDERHQRTTEAKKNSTQDIQAIKGKEGDEGSERQKETKALK